jgi:hypothetical protein
MADYLPALRFAIVKFDPVAGPQFRLRRCFKMDQKRGFR